MVSFRKQQMGASLIEVILVIVIGAGLLLLSVNQYLSFRRDADALQLQSNVDTLLQALAQFYYANCYGTYNPNAIPPTPPLTPGALNPAAVPVPKNPFPVTIQTMLVNNGYLTGPFPINPLVNSGTPSTQFGGYVAQLNEYTQNRLTCLGGTNATGVTPATGCTGGNVQIGVIVIWKPQVAVLIKDPTKVNSYQGLLNADCTSSLTGTTVSPCSAKKPGNYLVWERMPSFPATQGNSNAWGMRPVINNFTQLYTTYSKVYLTTVKGVTTPKNQTQYFLCGG